MAINDKNILTIGCSYKHPKGGIAQVLYNYDKFIFNDFNCIVNSVDGHAFCKLLKLFGAVILFIFRNIFNTNIKIVHIHTASYNSFKRSAIFVSLAKMFGKRVILHIHGGGFREYYQTNPSYISGVLNNCDCIITLTELWRKYFQTITRCKMIEVVENVIPEPVFKGIHRDNKFHLLFLGLITEAKGVFDLLEVIKEHNAEFNNKLILHVGGNGETENLQNYIRDNNLSDIVSYEGWVSGDKKIALLNRADAYILPSYTEGLPLSILEAMSYKLPILSTPVGGIPEVVSNGENGLLFTPGAKDEIYKSILMLLNNTEQRKKMGDNSYNKVCSYFPENVKSKLRFIYEQMLNV